MEITTRTLPATCRAAVAGWMLFLGAQGCGGGGRSIPHDVVELEGGRVVSVAAPHSGIVWVYEKEDDLVIYTGPVHKGDRITVDGEQHLRIEGVEMKTPAPRTSGHKHRYMVYFKS